MSPSIAQLPPRVLIIGAGLGGLSLAQGLKKAHIPFHVFERDPSSNFRPQGYRIKINPEGAQALKAVMSTEMWEYFEKSCAESKFGETNINALDGGIIASRAGPGARGGAIPYLADRTVLRTLLFQGLDEDVSFGKSLTHYDILDEGVVAHFADGSSEQGILLVGADGLRSPPVDTNGRCIYGKTPLTEELMKTYPAKGAKWMTLLLDKTPMTQTLDIDETPLSCLLEPVRFQDNELRSKLPQDYVYWVLISRSDVFGKSTEELLALDNKQSAELSLKLTEEWDESLRILFKKQDISQSSTLRISSAKPNIPVWEPSSRVTLLGDAVHVMSPSGGVGAVTAIMDAATLSGALAAEGINKKSIGEYEAIMRQYAKKSIERSYFGGKKMFGQRWFDDCEVLEF
ncbi:FAD/NAD(P)-binding domain-containing protein [Lepidopterella palustris CBS 459.81]|uniref:FAD/NAD(P)-binding domain-containing protein n=1 Tax=Lepidopterella palustris CBS 459.81 TaxID=1314670 RepID=A0A8E2EAB6_9PEZI|nr:FAD/NAD(P)-binding domain-containing protein [Lepidopterella palustris CBS 459.81]